MAFWLLLLLAYLAAYASALTNEDLAEGVLCDVRMWGDFKSSGLSPFVMHNDWYKPRGLVTSSALAVSEIDTQIPLLISTVAPKNKPIYFQASTGSKNYEEAKDQNGYHPLFKNSKDVKDIPKYRFSCENSGCYTAVSFTRFRGVIDFDLDESCSASFQLFSDPDDSGHLNVFKIDPATRDVAQVPTSNKNFVPSGTGSKGDGRKNFWAQTVGTPTFSVDSDSEKRNFHRIHFDFHVHQMRGGISATLWYKKYCDETLHGGGSVPFEALSTGARFALHEDDDAATQANGMLYMATDGVWPSLDFPMAIADRTREVDDVYGANTGRFFDTTSPLFAPAPTTTPMRFNYLSLSQETLFVEATTAGQYRTFVATGRVVDLPDNTRFEFQNSGDTPVKVYSCEDEAAGDLTHTPPRLSEQCRIDTVPPGVSRFVEVYNDATVTIAGAIANVSAAAIVSCKIATLGDLEGTPCSHFLRHAEPVWATEHNVPGTRTWVESYYTDVTQARQKTAAILSLQSLSVAEGFRFADGRVTLRLPPGKLEQLSVSSLMRNYYFDYVVSQWRVCLHPESTSMTSVSDSDITDYTVNVMEELESDEVDELVRTNLNAWNAHPSNGDIELDLRTLSSNTMTKLSNAVSAGWSELRFSARAEMQLNGQGSFPLAVSQVHGFPWRTDNSLLSFVEGSALSPVAWSMSALANSFELQPSASPWSKQLAITDAGMALLADIKQKQQDAGRDDTTFEAFVFVGNCNAFSVNGDPLRESAHTFALSLDDKFAVGVSPAPGQKVCIRTVAGDFFAAPALLELAPQTTWASFMQVAVISSFKSVNQTDTRVKTTVNFNKAMFLANVVPAIRRLESLDAEVSATWPLTTRSDVISFANSPLIPTPSLFAYGIKLELTPKTWLNGVEPDGWTTPGVGEMVASLGNLPRRIPSIIGLDSDEAVTYTFGNSTSNGLTVEWADLGALEPQLLDGTHPQLVGYNVNIEASDGSWTSGPVSLSATETRWELEVPQPLFDAANERKVTLKVTVLPVSHPLANQTFPGMPSWEPTTADIALQQLAPPIVPPELKDFFKQMSQSSYYEFGARFVWEHTETLDLTLEAAKTEVSLWWAPPTSSTLDFVHNVTVVRTDQVNGQGPDETHWVIDALPPGQYKLYLWTQATGRDKVNPRWLDRRSITVESPVATHLSFNLNTFFLSNSPDALNNVRAITFPMRGSHIPAGQTNLLNHIVTALTPVAKNDFNAPADFTAVSFTVSCVVEGLALANFMSTQTANEIQANEFNLASFSNPWLGTYNCSVTCDQLTTTVTETLVVEYDNEASGLLKSDGGSPSGLPSDVPTTLEFSTVPMLPARMHQLRFVFNSTEYLTCKPTPVTSATDIANRVAFDYTWSCLLPPALGANLLPQLRYHSALLAFSDTSSISYQAPNANPFSLRSVSAVNSLLPLQMKSNLPAQLTFDGTGFSVNPARFLSVSMRTVSDGKLWPCDISSSLSNSTFITCLSTKGIGGDVRMLIDVVAAPAGTFTQQFSRGQGDTHDLSFPFAPKPIRIFGCNGANPPVCDTKGASVLLEGVDVGSTQENVQVAVVIDAFVTVPATTVNTTHITFQMPALLDGVSRNPTVSVQRGAGIESAEIFGLFSYELPQLESIQGCSACNGGICDCARAGGDVVTVTGRHLGPSSLRVLFGATLVPTVNHDPVNPSEHITFALPPAIDSGARRALLAVTPDGEFSSGVLYMSYAACPPGTELNPGGHLCTDCQAGEYSFGGDQACTKCPDGSFAQRPRSSSCTLARAGFYSNDPKMELPCPSGTYSELQGMKECIACKGASFSMEDALNGSPTCEECPLGYFANSTACVQCNWTIGETSSSDGGGCTSCTRGNYLKISAPSDRDVQATCEECPAGTFSEAGATECEPCPPGSYSEIGSYTCTKCPAGSYAATNASTSCESCPPFTWQPATGSSFCAPCLAPSALDFSGAPVSGRETCGMCAAGQYAPVVVTPNGEHPVKYKGGCRMCPPNVDCRHTLSVRSSSANGAFDTSGGAQLLEGVDSMTEVSVGFPKAEEGYWLSVQDDGILEALPCAGDRCLGPDECQSSAHIVELTKENALALSAGTVIDTETLLEMTWIAMGPASCCSENRVESDTDWASNPLCGSCLPDHYEWGGNCLNCTSTRDAMIALVVFLLWIFVLVFHMASQSTRSEIKIFIYFVQMSLLFFGPDASWLQWTTALSGNVVESSGAPVCVARFKPSEKLLLNMFVPLLCFAELSLTAVVAGLFWRRRNRRLRHEARDNDAVVRHPLDKFKTSGFIRTGMMLMIFCFNAITDTAFGFFRCVDTGDRVRVVATYTGLECGSSEWNQTLPVVLIFMAIVSFGVPVLTALLFWRARKRRTVFTLKFLERYGVLYEHYRCGVAHIWECVVFLRRLVLIFISSMLVRDRSALYSALSVANVTALLAHVLVQPFWKQFDNVCEAISLALLTLLTIALADTELPMSSGQEAAFATLVLTPSLLLVLFTGARLLMVRFAPAQWLSLEKQSRRRLAWLKRIVMGDDGVKRVGDSADKEEDALGFLYEMAADEMSPQELCERNFRAMLRAGASRRIALRRTLSSQVDSRVRNGVTFREYLAKRKDHEDPAHRDGDGVAGAMLELSPFDTTTQTSPPANRPSFDMPLDESDFDEDDVQAPLS